MNLLSNAASRILSLGPQPSNREFESKIPRPDLRCGLAQFDISLLTTAMAPNDEDEWFRLYHNPPSPEELEEKLAPFAQFFELQSDGCAFMQDLDPLEDAKEQPIEKLFMDMLTDSRHFVNNRRIRGISPFWAALTLYGLQTNASGGGGGYHTSVRGAGPLTTLVLPHHEEAERWQQLWVNVLSKEHIDQLPGDPEKRDCIFPWSFPTRTADQGKTLPQDAHPLQVLWGMPRRIRLVFNNNGGRCDLTGEDCRTLVTGFRRRTKGTDYGDYWKHPFTPYEVSDSKPKPLLGKADCLTYRHWCTFALPNARENLDCAQVISAYLNSRAEFLCNDASAAMLWVSGYDMERAKTKALSWYETKLPMYSIPTERREWVADFANTLTEAASSCSKTLETFIKNVALFKKEKPKKDKPQTGDFAASPSKSKQNPNLDIISLTLLERTEARFFQFLKQVITCDDPEEESIDLKDHWRSHIGRQAIAIFDAHAFATTETPSSLAELTQIRAQFIQKLWGNKTMKTLKKPEDDNGQT